MLKLGRVTKVKVLFLVLVFVFNFDLFKFSAAILEKGLLRAVIGKMELIMPAWDYPLLACVTDTNYRRLLDSYLQGNFRLQRRLPAASPVWKTSLKAKLL